jgi:group I intron endonuclease
MIMPFFIYKITNKINNKIYIGKSKDPDKRFKRHLYVSEHPNTGPNQFQPIHAALAKYGSNNFNLEIIDECMLEGEIFDKEIYWISYYKSNMKKYPNIGYNLTDGGEGHSGLSPSLATRKKISQANSGENNGMFDNTHSHKTREQMSKSQSFRSNRDPLSDEHKQKNREAALKQDKSYRIPLEIKEQVVPLYNSGKFTKKQIADKLGLKYNSVVKIIRTA